MAGVPTAPPKRPNGCPPGQGTVASQPNPGRRTGYIGNPPHERTDELAQKVKETARTLLPVAFVASQCGMAWSTLYKYYRKELDQGRSETLSVIAAQEVKQAMSGPSAEIKGDPESRRFVLSRMLGLMSREPPAPEPEPGEDPATGIDLSMLTAEELTTYGRLSAKLAGVDPDSIEFEIVEDNG